MTMNKIHQKAKYRFLWLIIAATLLIAYGFVFWYMKTKVETANFENSSARIAYEQKDTLQGVTDMLSEIAPDVEKVDTFFVGLDREVDFINLLEQKAVEQNVEARTTSLDILEEPENERDKLPYGEVLQVGLFVSGDWNDVMQYIRLVENLPYNIWIESLRISLEEQDLEDGGSVEGVFIWEANFVINVVKHEAL